MSNAHSHDGHRERLRQRYLKFGPDSLDDHELLELLLYYSKPRVNTNVTAHALINENGSFESVFAAEADRLKTTCGVGDSSAILLSLVGAIHKRLSESPAPHAKFCGTLSSVGELLLNHYSTALVEELCVMLLDKSMNLMQIFTVSSGNKQSSVASHTEIAQKALLKGAAGVIIAHNHPGGDPLPSSSDRNFTHLLEASLYAINIALIEHIIVCNGSYMPTMMSNSGPGRLSLINGLFGEDFFRKFYSN